MPQLKIEYPWLKKGAYSQSLQVVALNLSVAYQNFFEKKAGFPSFKSKHGRQSVSYPQNVKVGEKSIKLPVIGEVNCKVHRTFDGTVKTVTVSKNPDGKTYIEVDRFCSSSKTCNSCLPKVSEMSLAVRHWDCPKCKSRNDARGTLCARDVTAAKNIRDEALRFLALGTSTAASRGSVSRGGKISVLSDAVPRKSGSYPLSTSGG